MGCAPATPADLGLGWDGHCGGFEGVEGDAGVAAGDVGERAEGIVADMDVQGGEATVLIGEGGAQDALDLLRLKRLHAEDAGAGEEGADDFEGGVFGGGADEGDGAVFDVGEDGVLLGFVEAVDFVYEEDGAPTAWGQWAAAGLWRRGRRLRIAGRCSALS